MLMMVRKRFLRKKLDEDQYTSCSSIYLAQDINTQSISHTAYVFQFQSSEI